MKRAEHRKDFENCKCSRNRKDANLSRCRNHQKSRLRNRRPRRRRPHFPILISRSVCEEMEITKIYEARDYRLFVCVGDDLAKKNGDVRSQRMRFRWLTSSVECRWKRIR